MAGLLAAFMSTFDSTVNAGAAYLVNDVYKRYIRPDAAARQYVVLGYFASLALVPVAVIVGIQLKSIHGITKWITFALYGGYMAPNLLKWHWWRFNGYGYFAGMISGMVVAVASRLLLPHIDSMYHLFLIFPISVIACIAFCLLTPHDDMEVLKAFYRNVRPWGIWGRVQQEIAKEDPSLQPNRDFAWDMFNVVNGIVWQFCLMAAPMCLVARRWDAFWWTAGIVAVTSVIMKFTWYDRLPPA